MLLIPSVIAVVLSSVCAIAAPLSAPEIGDNAVLKSRQATRDSIVRNLAASRTRAKRSGPSNVVYTCPPRDNGGFDVGMTSNDGTTLFCSYPAFPGENPNDFFCKYSATTGLLTQDADAGFCPTSAPGSSKRRNVEDAAIEGAALLEAIALKIAKAQELSV